MKDNNKDLEIEISKNEYGYKLNTKKQEFNDYSNYHSITRRTEYDLNFLAEKPTEIISRLKEKSCKTNKKCYCRTSIAEKLENFIKENSYSKD
jgi:hypothetical protein